MRPVTIVVPYPAGGVVDIRVREVAERLENELSQPIVIDNRPGAMGMIGAERVAKAKPDGYTVLAGTISDLAIVPAYGVKASFDYDKEIAPITPYVHGNSILVVPSSMNVRSAAELISMLKKNPGDVTYATAGKGSIGHFLGRLFLRAGGLEAVDVPYKGASAALPDLVSGRVQFMFDFVPTSLPFIQGGKLRALMTTSTKRIPIIPDVPTARELGFPELEVMTWAGFFVPTGTPRAVVDRLYAAIAKALLDPELRARWEAAGAEAVSSSPEAFADFVKAERAKWERFAKATGIKVE